jgi:hypothetical protein
VRHARQRQDLLLDIRRQSDQPHNLTDPFFADAAQPRQVRVVLRQTTPDQVVEADRQCQHFCNAWQPASRHNRFLPIFLRAARPQLKLDLIHARSTSCNKHICFTPAERNPSVTVPVRPS